MICGIYKITNQVNGKSYIGLSRNIQKRWRQHRSGLGKKSALERGSYPIRAAFLKYGLENFKFEVIEECAERDLPAREQFWIDKTNSEYNCNIWTPARKKKQVEQLEPKFWIQYHNCDKLGYIPAEYTLDDPSNIDEDVDNILSGISTDKRSVLNTQGDTVFLIAGIGNKPKQYYLMYRFTIEEIQTIDQNTANLEEGVMNYDAFGSGWLVNPQLLNSSEFNKFMDYCGNFGFGFMPVSNSSYLETLINLSEKHKLQTVDFPKYIEGFYSKVLSTNPKELSILDRRGVARHVALSLHPSDAIFILTGEYTRIVVFGMTEFEIRYRNRLLIHTLAFSEDDNQDTSDSPKEIFSELYLVTLELLGQFGLDQESFPAHAIQGWVIVDNIFKYDPETFAIDMDAHGKGDDLDAYRIERGFTEGDAWCIQVSAPVLLKKAIPIYEPEGTQDGYFWFPASERDIKSFRHALKYTTPK